MTYSLLIVDDEPLNTQLLTLLLTNEGYAVTVAQAPTEALALLSHNTYALILLDVMLPEMDGFELCRRIRRTATTPILFISARGDVTDAIRGREAGGDDYLSKPFSPDELLLRIRALVARDGADVPPGAVLPPAAHVRSSRPDGGASGV